MIDTHLFAIHVQSFWSDNIAVDDVQSINQVDLVHRLVKVLRCDMRDQFIFFDKFYHGLVEIVQISKKDIAVKVLTIQNNQQKSSKIVFLLPLLKKEALEDAIYSLAELGADEIRLVITQKSRQALLHDKEYQRLQNIIISAAEQSKNYSYPLLYESQKLCDVVDQEIIDKNLLSIVFDVQGQSFFQLQDQLLSRDVCLLVGPEAGLLQQELSWLQDKKFVSCCLTTTTLRAIQAVTLGLGIFCLKK